MSRRLLKPQTSERSRRRPHVSISPPSCSCRHCQLWRTCRCSTPLRRRRHSRYARSSDANCGWNFSIIPLFGCSPVDSAQQRQKLNNLILTWHKSSGESQSAGRNEADACRRSLQVSMRQWQSCTAVTMRTNLNSETCGRYTASDPLWSAAAQSSLEVPVSVDRDRSGHAVCTHVGCLLREHC